MNYLIEDNSEIENSLPKLAIILVNWFSYEVSRNCLLSLRELDYGNFHVIVVDNASTDNSPDQLALEFQEATFLRNKENLGFTGGNNTGIKHALEQGFELIMLLNNDTVVTPGFASILVHSLMSSNNIGAVQPKIRFNRNRNKIWNAGSRFNHFFGTSRPIGLNQVDKGQFDERKFIPWITGCCFLLKAETVKEIGLLDQKFFCYYEDTDWSFKIRKLGLKLLYEPQALIYHEVGKSNDNSVNQTKEGRLSPFVHYVTLRNHIFLVRRYKKLINPIGGWLNQFFKVATYLVYFLARGRFEKFKAVIRGVKDGLTK